MASKYRTLSLLVLAVVVFAALALLQSPDAAADGFDWSGFYVGAQGGYLWSSLPSAQGRDPKGGFTGGYAGYNYQLPGSPLVLGVEGSFESISQKRFYPRPKTGGAIVPFSGVIFPTTGASITEIDRTAGARVRFGYAIDWLMIYGGAGVSKTWWTRREEITVGVPAGVGGGGFTKDRKRDLSVSLAAGVEAAVWDHVVARLEYRRDVDANRDRRIVAGLSYLFGQDKLEKAAAGAVDWTGFHVGVEGGYGRAKVNRDFDGFGSIARPDGGLVGAFAGYDYKFSGTALVIGAETDFAYARMSETDKARDPLFKTVYQKTVERENWVGATRGRVGLAFDRMLVFADGGVAYSERERTVHRYDLFVVPPQSGKVWNIGWTIGGGAEFAVTDDISARAEYRYADYGSDSRRTGGPFFRITDRTKLQDERVMVGLAYRIH